MEGRGGECRAVHPDPQIVGGDHGHLPAEGEQLQGQRLQTRDAQDEMLPVMLLGNADEQKPAKDGTVESWGRSEDNPVGGWYGRRNGYRGRFGMYLPPLLEALGLAELTHEARNNSMRGI